MGKNKNGRPKKIQKNAQEIRQTFFRVVKTVESKLDEYISEADEIKKHDLFDDIVFRLRGLVTGTDALIRKTGLYKEFFFPCTTYRRHFIERDNYHGFIDVLYEDGKPFYRRRVFDKNKFRGVLGYELWL